MAVCTVCGAVMHKDDIENHKCEEANIPVKGSEMIAGVAKVQVKKEIIKEDL